MADEEIRFGDNDRLAALVAHLVGAELLVLLTDTAGLLTEDPRRTATGSLIEEVVEIDHELERIAGGPGTRGGQRGHGLEAGRGQDRRVVGGGGGHRRRLPARGAGRGDRVGARRGDPVPAPGPAPAGPQAVDRLRRRGRRGPSWSTPGPAGPWSSGAARCCRPGWSSVRGDFDADDAVEIAGPDGAVFAKGLVRHARPTRWPTWAGRRSDELPDGRRPPRWSTATIWSCSTEPEPAGRPGHGGADRPASTLTRCHRAHLTTMIDLGRRAKAASRVLARASSARPGRGPATVRRPARAAVGPASSTANAADVGRAERPGPTPPPSTGCASTPAGWPAMADGLRKVAALPDPVGEVVDGWVRPNGLRVERVRVPLGRGRHHLREPAQRDQRRRRPVPQGRATPSCCGARRRPSPPTWPSPAVLRDGLAKAGLPDDAVGLVEDTSRDVGGGVHAARRVHRLPDPPGRAVAASPSVREHATVPYVIDGAGNCHVYVDARRRPRHGRVHRGQRQDPAARGVQRGRDAPRPPGRWPRPSCPGWPGPCAGVDLLGDAATRAVLPGRGRGHRRGLRHRVPGPHPVGGRGRRPRRGHRPHRPVTARATPRPS